MDPIFPLFQDKQALIIGDPQLRRPQRGRRLPPRNAERRGPPDHHIPDPPQPRSPSPPHRPHLARSHRPLAPTRLLNHARKPTPASNHRTKPITHPLRPHMPLKPPTASATRLWASQAFQGAFPSSSDPPRFRASGPDNTPILAPTSPFPPLWRGLPAFQGREPCERRLHPSIAPVGRHRQKCKAPRRRTTVAPRAKRRRGPQGPRSNRQPQSPATGHRPKLPPPPVGRHLLPLQHRLHHGHPGAPNLHRFQQPVSLVHHLLVQLLPTRHPVAHQPLHHPLQTTMSRRFNNRFCVICAIGQAHHLSGPAMVTMSSLAPTHSIRSESLDPPHDRKATADGFRASQSGGPQGNGPMAASSIPGDTARLTRSMTSVGAEQGVTTCKRRIASLKSLLSRSGCLT